VFPVSGVKSRNSLKNVPKSQMMPDQVALLSAVQIATEATAAGGIVDSS
jgi:hypothetical protein